MSDCYLLPATTYQPPAAKSRRRNRSLNAIIEEPATAKSTAGTTGTTGTASSNDGWEGYETRNTYSSMQRRRTPNKVAKVVRWLSPVSDHFPTPRGVNFLSAPILPGTPLREASEASESSECDDDCDGSSDASSSAPSSKMWHRESVMTDVTEFDDVCGVSDDETKDVDRPLATLVISHATTRHGETAGPEEKSMSPTTPTPTPTLSSTVELPLTVKCMMEARQEQEIPCISAPPSLDGSLDSEGLAVSSQPSTPSIQAHEDEAWCGVQLPPAALATLETLQALSGSDTRYFPSRTDECDELGEVAEAMPETPEMSDTHQPGLRRASCPQTDSSHAPSSAPAPAPASASACASGPSLAKMSLAELSKLDIPSPAGFFSDLSSASRKTWHVAGTTDSAPPTSTTAENFYRMPWSESEVRPQTVLQTVPQTVSQPVSQRGDDVTAAVDSTRSHQDRTELWLLAQGAYRQNVVDSSDHARDRYDSGVPLEPASVVPPRLLGQPSHLSPKALPPNVLRRESAYIRAFTDASVRRCAHDAFVHQKPRFEALQAQRVSLKDAHRNQLLGTYQLTVVPPSSRKRLSANVVRGDTDLVDDPEALRRENEAQALAQMGAATWHVAATRLLNGGHLVAAPVAKHLARDRARDRGRPRILDLAGQATCDWAWHVALQFPHALVYTVTTTAIRHVSNSNIGGPANHTTVAVQRLTRLPFPDDSLDVISARELHAVLKTRGEGGVDEWDACLSECLRVLRPGGFLDFAVLDADLVNAGARAHARSLEFAFSLHTLGYDPRPTKAFLGRLAAAGFGHVRRAWMCLPVGPKYAAAPAHASTGPHPDPATDGRTLSLDAMVTGSADGAAAVTGLTAGWSWERWLLRADMEKAAAGRQLGETVVVAPGDVMADVHVVVEDGRATGSAFRMLRGYARKPKPRGDMGLISMVLDTDGLC